MTKIQYHILVCGGNSCRGTESADILGRMRETVEEAAPGAGIQVIGTGCFGLCDKGPVVKILPDGTVYTGVKPEDCTSIVREHILGGKKVERLLYAGGAVQRKQIRIALSLLPA